MHTENLKTGKKVSCNDTFTLRIMRTYGMFKSNDFLTWKPINIMLGLMLAHIFLKVVVLVNLTDGRRLSSHSQIKINYRNIRQMTIVLCG